jgi:hypothetical protein
MAEESGPLEALGKIVPSMYYDLIARVCSGLPFLVALLWDRKDMIGELTWVKLILALGAGYIAGLLLTPLSLPWGLVHLLVRLILKMRIKDWQYGLTLYDAILVKDKEAGGTLVKMQAEAVLCQNLFGAFIALIIINATGVMPVPLVKYCSRSCFFIIFSILAASSVNRIIAYLIRENRLYKIHVETAVSFLALRDEPHE